MNPVQVRGIKIGEGVPKICVPIVGITREQIIEEAKSFQHIPVDIVEWRADWYEDVFDYDKVADTLSELRKVLGEIPLLFTFRTKKEGGEKEIQDNIYAQLNEKAAGTGYVDLIDVEIFTGDKVVAQIIEKAHEYEVKVVASNHDFYKTPDKEEIVKRLQRMAEAGADIPKIAVMPQNKKDVLTLLSATEEAASLISRPIITMSMAGTGVISRVCGEIFGSALTFGAAKKASAPGQMAVEELHTVLEVLHKSLS